MFASLLLAAVAAAPIPLDPPVVAGVTMAPGGRGGEATLLFTNPDPRSAAAVPDSVVAVLRGAWGDAPVTLTIAAPGGRAVAPAGGFVRVRYAFPLLRAPVGEAVLAVGESRFALSPAPDAARVAAAAAPPPRSDRAAGRGALLPNLAPYRPVYAVYGPGTDTAARLQLSAQYQLFGRIDRPTGDWKEGISVAYTQRMFWDLERRSKPFRDVDYIPEIFYRHDVASPVRGAMLSVRGGFLHDSNGRGGAASRGFQIVYVEPVARFRLLGLDASVAPRLYRYVGGRDGNPDIARYRGHQALAVAIGRDDGVRLATEGRYNFGSGKGAVEGELSYPLTRLIGVPIYLVAQGFAGYGEDLRDYDRRQTRLRIGVGVVR